MKTKQDKITSVRMREMNNSKKKIFKETSDKVVKIIEKYVENNSEDEELSIDESFSNISINSVDFIKIIVGIETEFDFEFYDDDLRMDRFQNIHEILDYIIERKHNE